MLWIKKPHAGQIGVALHYQHVQKYLRCIIYSNDYLTKNYSSLTSKFISTQHNFFNSFTFIEVDVGLLLQQMPDPSFTDKTINTKLISNVR